MVKRRFHFLVLVYVALSLVSCQDDGAALQDDVLPEVNTDTLVENENPMYNVEPVWEDPQPIEEPVGEDLQPIEEPPQPMEDPQPVEEPLSENNEMGPPPDEEFVDFPPPPSDDMPPGEGPAEMTSKRIKRKRSTTQAPPSESCETLLVDQNNDCLYNVPEGYEPSSCVFNILNEDCDWNCTCSAYGTEEPLPEVITTELPSLEISESKESCETDRKIKFKNCFIKVKGLVQRH